MSKSNKRYIRSDEDTEREEKLLAQLEAHPRKPIPPPGHFHNTGEKQRRRKDRKQERTRLRDMTKEFNNG